LLYEGSVMVTRQRRPGPSRRVMALWKMAEYSFCLLISHQMLYSPTVRLKI
jgi:hypothetical protein